MIMELVEIGYLEQFTGDYRKYQAKDNTGIDRSCSGIQENG
jgi:hypothetical protein